MSQTSWGLSQHNQGAILTDGHEFTKKQETKNGNIQGSAQGGGANAKRQQQPEKNVFFPLETNTLMKYFVVVQMQGFSSRKQNQAKIQQVPVNSSTVANCLQSEFEKKPFS